MSKVIDTNAKIGYRINSFVKRYDYCFAWQFSRVVLFLIPNYVGIDLWNISAYIHTYDACLKSNGAAVTNNLFQSQKKKYV